MGERLLCKQEVVGSIPITSTTERAKLVSRCGSGACAARAPARTLQGSVRRKARQRCACTARAFRAGAREIDREEKVCAGASAFARVIFDRVKRE